MLGSDHLQSPAKVSDTVCSLERDTPGGPEEPGCVQARWRRIWVSCLGQRRSLTIWSVAGGSWVAEGLLPCG
jgi:hypothetical protein